MLCQSDVGRLEWWGTASRDRSMGSVMRGFAPTSEIGRGIMVIGIFVQNTMINTMIYIWQGKALKFKAVKISFDVWINKVIALRGSTPKRESQQQCSYTNNTANHAMLCHTMTYNATPYNICNAICCHTMQHHNHHAMQHHTTPFHAMQWHTMQYNAIHCYATPCNTIP